LTSMLPWIPMITGELGGAFKPPIVIHARSDGLQEISEVMYAYFSLHHCFAQRRTRS
jgi:hypothetical protein